ncbi:MAG TPA: hypothetical protein VIS77_04825 [Burkholderiales bacterium]
MKKSTRLTGTAIAAAAASMFAFGAMAAPLTAVDATAVKCEGANACKGQSECKTAKSECKGLNACKGNGWKEMSKADCDKAKMSKKK